MHAAALAGYYGNIWKFNPNELCKPGKLWAGTDYCTGINCPPNYLDGLGNFAPQGELTNLYGRGFGVNDLSLNEKDGYLYEASSENRKKLYVVNYGDALAGIQPSVVVATPN